MIQIAAFSTGALVIAVNAMLVYSILRPSRRIWPPPAQKTWQYYVVWLLTILSFGGFVLVGILDWNSLGWPGRCALVHRSASDSPRECLGVAWRSSIESENDFWACRSSGH